MPSYEEALVGIIAGMVEDYMVVSWEHIEKKVMCADKKAEVQDAIIDVHASVITALCDVAKKYQKKESSDNGTL